MKVVVDANVAVALVVPTAYSEAAAKKIVEWITADVDLVAPALWSYEAVSALRKYIASGEMDAEEADSAVTRLLTAGPLGRNPRNGYI